MESCLSKAISGAVEIAAGAVLIATGVGAGFGYSLVAMGVGQELSEVADLLRGQRGTANTVRQAAAPRRVIYGTQRVGAVEVFESTTGGSKDQYNMVLVFAAHEISNFLELFLDGRKVFWAHSGPGYTVRNGIGFGGGADGVDHYDPAGNLYNFANAYSGHRGVWVEARFGDQAAGDYLTSLQANDSRWGPNTNGDTPTLEGHAYLYLKTEYNTDDFPQKPDARATIAGKAVYDPRTGTTAWSDNAALVIADVLTNSDYGLGMTVNQAQLIAAANICDEPVAFSGSGGGTEARYTANYTWTMDKSVGDVLNDLVAGMGGRLSYINGEWYIFPAAFVGPTASFSSASLLDRPSWSAQKKFSAKANYCQGTFIAPTYPYAVAGNYYGSADAGSSTQNNFSYAYTPTSYPTYACDTLHGYASDQYLTEDGGVELPLTVDFSSVLSITQAQRLAKIALLRNRQQGSGTLTMGPEALILQPNDTFYFSWPERGWSEKLLEVLRIDTSITAGAQGAPQIAVTLTVAETDPSVYVWNAGDELTPYDLPATVDRGLYQTAPPTSVTLSSSAATALLQLDGTVVPRIEVQWNTPADIRVTAIELQYQLVGATSWSDGGTVSVASNVAFIPVVAGQAYNVRVRSIRTGNGNSSWVTVSGFTASLVLSVLSSSGVGVGSLIGEAFSDGTAAIICLPFLAAVGSASVWVTPTPSTDSGLLQGTLYYVYYIDPSFAGGAVTAIATTDPADFRGKVGYFLIDEIVTPSAPTTSGGSGTAGIRISPSSFHDIGTRTTSSADAAYDGNISSAASVSGVSRTLAHYPTGVDITPITTQGSCVYDGFLPSSSTADAVLTVVASSTITGAGTATVTASYGSTSSALLSQSSSTGAASYTLSIPAGTDFSTITISCTAVAEEPTTLSVTNTVTLTINEIFLDY